MERQLSAMKTSVLFSSPLFSSVLFCCLDEFPYHDVRQIMHSMTTPFRSTIQIHPKDHFSMWQFGRSGRRSLLRPSHPAPPRHLNCLSSHIYTLSSVCSVHPTPCLHSDIRCHNEGKVLSCGMRDPRSQSRAEQSRVEQSREVG